MAMITFTAQHADRSNNTGYQFEFYCDRCRSGHISTFQASKLGMAEGFLRAAGGLFGGTVGKIAYAGDSIKDAFRGPARDAAFAKAVEEAKQHFKQCPQCGKWVCTSKCWNTARLQCKACAPDAKEGAPANQPAPNSPTGAQSVKCPGCGAASTAGKFCPECGKPTPAVKTECPKCKARLVPGAKFCPECGEKLV